MDPHAELTSCAGIYYVARCGQLEIRLQPCTPRDAPMLTDWADAALHDDYFFRRGHWRSLICDHDAQVYAVTLAHRQEAELTQLVGIAITRSHSRLLNLWLERTIRGMGIGTMVLEALQPDEIRCKTDSSAGDPTDFYRSRGYDVLACGQGANHNITILRRRPTHLLPEH
jgi:hypothetical protein